MACPYFLPSSESIQQAPIRPARTPLGGLHSGACLAHPDGPITPSADLLREPCNFGYGRAICPHFPAGATADAVRFSLYGGRMIYVLEKDGTPQEHGIRDAIPAGSILETQAAIFVANHQ